MMKHFILSGTQKQLYITPVINPIQKKTALSREWKEKEGWIKLQILDHSDSIQPRQRLSSPSDITSSCQNPQKYQ